MTESSTPRTPRTDGVDVGITAEVVTAESYRRMREHARTLELELADQKRALSEVPAMRWIPVEERMPKPVPRVVLSQGLDSRPCTCHPDDNPPVPCPRKFALSECRKAAGVRVLTDFTESMALLKDA